jgi:hypothetical protein
MRELGLNLCVRYLVEQAVGNTGVELWPDGLWFDEATKSNVEARDGALGLAAQDLLKRGLIVARPPDVGGYRLDLSI